MSLKQKKGNPSAPDDIVVWIICFMVRCANEPLLLSVTMHKKKPSEAAQRTNNTRESSRGEN